MEQAGPLFAKRILAAVVLVVAAYVVFKLVLGIAVALAGTIVVILAIAAIVWAIRVL
jgi:hypothetical protein